MISIEFDVRSMVVINKLASSMGTWDRVMHKETADEISDAAKQYMKPLMSVRPVKTGRAENALRSDVSVVSNGFNIDFYGNFYSNYVDEGSPFTRIFASTYGLWGFPIKTGEGGKIFRASISGVGLGNSPYADMLPTHFSQRTVDHLASGPATDIAFNNMMHWMEVVVG